MDIIIQKSHFHPARRYPYRKRQKNITTQIQSFIVLLDMKALLERGREFERSIRF